MKETDANIARRNKMQDSTLADTDYPHFSIFTFEVNCAFMEEKDNHVAKVVIDEEELDGIVIYSSLNLEQCSSVKNVGI